MADIKLNLDRTEFDKGVAAVLKSLAKIRKAAKETKKILNSLYENPNKKQP